MGDFAPTVTGSDFYRMELEQVDGYRNYVPDPQP